MAGIIFEFFTTLISSNFFSFHNLSKFIDSENKMVSYPSLFMMSKCMDGTVREESSWNSSSDVILLNFRQSLSLFGEVRHVSNVLTVNISAKVGVYGIG